MHDQEQLTKRVLREVAGFLGGPRRGNDEWEFSFGVHLRSNWGVVYGGATAAACLAVARGEAPDRSPRSLHVQMIRSVPCGPAFAVADVRHAGRAVGTVQVDLHDQRRKLAATALVTMVAPDAVVATHHDTTARRFQTRRVTADYDVPAPISDALRLSTGVWTEVDNLPPSITGEPAAAVTLTPPWANLVNTGPEVACLAADVANGLPIYRALGNAGVSWPNTDLSLRFTTAPATAEVIATGTLVSLQHGTSTVSIEVQAGDQQLAHGLSTSLLLPIPS